MLSNVPTLTHSAIDLCRSSSRLCFPKSDSDFHVSDFGRVMNTNALLSFLLSLSIRQRLSMPVSSWKYCLETFALSTFLRLWRLYKFAYRTITGQGAIERLCNSVAHTQTLRNEEKELDISSRELKNVAWRLGISLPKLVLIHARLGLLHREHKKHWKRFEQVSELNVS